LKEEKRYRVAEETLHFSYFNYIDFNWIYFNYIDFNWMNWVVLVDNTYNKVII